MPCININLPEVKELSDKLQAPVGLVATAIGMWQDDNNNYDRFPNYEEVKQYLYKDNKLLNNNTTTSNIKEGVSELFESTPELANAVYEALGIEVNNFKLIPNKEKHPEDANTYDVIYNNEKIGIVALFEGKNKVIKGVKLDEKFRNKGLGKKLYKFLNLQANLQGGVLFSDPEQQSADARRLWNSLIKEGVVNIATADEQSLKFNIDYKQQAQQLYSQYLDTIFPDSKVKDVVYHSRFNVSNIKNKDRWRNGFYSGTKDQADLMADMAESSNDLMTTSALLINMQNPKVTTYADRKVEDYKNTNDGFIIEATEKDALQLIGDRDGYNIENFKKEYVVFEPEQIHILGSKQDIEGFRDFVSGKKENIGNLDNLQYQFRVVNNIINNLDKVNKWFKQIGNNDTFWNKIGNDLQIPKEQINLLKESKGNTIEEKLASFAANYSFTVEINTAKSPVPNYKGDNIENTTMSFEYNGYKYITDGGMYIKKSLTNEDDFDSVSKKEFNELREKYIKENELQPTQYYSNLTVPGGTNYTEQEIATPAITPSIKGHAQFATENGIGWFRSDDKSIGETSSVKEQVVMHEGVPVWTGKMVDISKGGTSTKTRRILEVQSDLFQKGRDNVDLITPDLGLDDLKSLYERNKITEEEYNRYLKNSQNRPTKNQPKNQFLQLLNKDNNWVTFFVKSIIQDSAKKGYEKVLFPTGNTASKIEGHTTLEEFKKEKENRIKKLEEKLKNIKQESSDIYTKDGRYAAVRFQLERLKQGIIPESYSTSTNLGGLLDSNISAFYHKGQIAIWQNKDINSFSEKFAKEESENQHGVKFWILKDNLQKDLIEASLNNLENEFKSLPKEILKREKESTNNEINQLKQELERVEKEGFGALKPIYNFYENTVTNILINNIYGKESKFVNYEFTFNNDKYERLNDKNQYLKNSKEITQKEFNSVQNSVTKQDKKEGKFTDKYYVNSNAFITDEYGNTWNEVEIKNEYNFPILFSLNNNKTPEQQLEEFNKNESTTKYDEKILKAANNSKSSKPIDRDNYRNLIFKLRQKYPDLIFTMKSVLNPYGGYYEGILVAQIDSKVKNQKFQLGNNLLPSITEVNNSMISLLNKLGIKLEFSKNGKLTLPNGIEVDGVAFADIFNRVIQVVEGKMDGTTLPEEAAHIFTLLMKADDNLKQAMIKNVVKLQIYQDVKNDPKYQAQYGDNEDLYIIEAIGKVIAATMLNQPVLEAKSNKKALWVNIWFNNLISKLKQLFKINNTNNELQQILKPFIEVKDMMLDENIQNLLSLDEFKSLNTNNNKFQLFQLDNGNVSPEEYKNTVIDKIVNRFKINGNVAIDTSNNREYSYEPTNSISFKDVKSSNLGGQTHFKNFRNDLIESLKEIRSGITSDALSENKRKVISEYANQVNNEINKLYDPENQKDINVLFNVPYLDNKSNTVKTADLLIVLPDGTVDIKLFESINTSKKNGEYNVNWKTYSNFKDTIDSIKSYLTKIGIVKSVSIKIQPVLVKTQLFKNVKRFNTEGIGDPIAVFDVDGDIYKKFPNNIFTKNNARITSNEYTLGVAEPNAVNVTTISDYIEVSPVKVTESSPELDLFTTRSGLSNIDNININIVNFIKVLEDRLLKLEKSKLDWKTKAEAKSKILLTISQLLNRENYLYLTTSLLSHLEDFRTKLDESDLSISDLENGLEFITNVRNLRQNKVIDRDIINELLKNNEIDEGTATTIIQNLNALIGLSDELLFTINEKIKINNIKLGNAENVNLNSNGNLLENINELPAEQRNEVIRASNLDSILGRIESNLLKFRQLASKNKWLKTALSIFDKQNQKIENEVLDFQKQLLKFKDKLGDRILSLINKDTDNLITKTKKEYWELKRNAIEKNNWRWIAENHNIKEGAKEEYDEALENYIKTLDNNLALSDIERESFLLRFKNQNDIWSDVHKKQALLSYGFKYLEIKNDWLSDEYKNLPSDLKEFYDFYHKTMVNLSYVLDARDKFNGNFIPNISKTLLESIFNGNSLNMESFIGSLKFTGESIGHLNPTTNKIEYTIPKYFINELTDVNGNPLTGQTKSHDLYKSLSAFYAMAMNYKYKSEVEDDMASLLHGIQNEPVLDKINGQYKVIDDNTDNTEVLRDFVNWALYSIDNKSKDSKFLGTNLSANKTIKQFKKTITTTSLTLNFLSIVANKVGNEVNLFMEAAGGKMFNTKDALWARAKLKHVFDNPEVVGFLYKSGILDTKENIKNNNKSLSLSKIINGYDKVNGLFIQHFLEKDFTNRVALILAKNYTIDENKKIVKITDEKNQKNLLELGKIDGDSYTLDVSDEELLKFRNKVSYYNEKLTGFSDREDKMRIQLYSLGDLLTTFRGWIPKMYEARFTKGYYNDEADAWVQGRYLTFYRDLVDSKGKSMLNNLMYTLPFSNTLFKENFENSVRARAEKAFYKEMETNPNILLDTKEEYIETFIANTKMNLMELRIMLAITLFIAMLGGFDDDKKKKNKGAITILKRSFSELVFFNPAFLQTGALSIIKSPIVGTNFVTNNLSLLGNLMYLPFADDKEKVGIKIGKEIIKDIPAASGMYGNIENFKDAIN